jgi:hypothetical protein
MDNSNSLKPYSKAATFICKFCGYTTTIYSDVEWVVINKDSFIEEPSGKNVIIGFIYREDLDCIEILHPQCTHILLSDYNSNTWDTPGLKIHWTEQPIFCKPCDKTTMEFVEYTKGANIELFYKICVNALKLAHEPMSWKREDGSSYIVIFGNGNKFSAT